MHPPDDDRLAVRIADLEAQYRTMQAKLARARAGLILLAITAPVVACTLGARPDADDRIVAREIRLEDPDGSVMLLNASRLALLQNDGNYHVSIGKPGIVLYGPERTPRASLLLNEEGSATMRFTNKAQSTVLSLSAGTEDRGSLSFGDPSKGVDSLAGIGLDEDGAWLNLRDGTARNRTGLSFNTHEDWSQVNFYDRNGTSLVILQKQDGIPIFAYRTAEGVLQSVDVLGKRP